METVLGSSSSSSSSTAADLVIPSSSSCPPEPEEDDGGETRNKDLNLDLITEIFARLPRKTLMRFKCISKFWYSLITSPNFISMHSTRSQTVTLFSPEIGKTTTTLSFQFGENLEEKQPKLSNKDVIEDVEMMGCFNGVVCLSLSKRPQIIALWNPATGQVRRISGAPMGGHFSVFFFEPVTNAFKQAQIKFFTIQGDFRAQVNVLCTATNSWKSNNVVVPFKIHPSGNAVYVNGYIYWHIGRSWTFLGNYILSYNMSDEVFERIEMPSCPAFFVHYRLTAYKGSLALFANFQTRSKYSIMNNEVDVWVLNDRGGANQSWSKILTCKPSMMVARVVGFFSKDGLDYVLTYCNANKKYYYYDPGNGVTNKFFTRKSISQTFPYTENLVSLY